MANPRQHPDPHDEVKLEQLLKSCYAGAPPSAEFQEALLRQLDQEFARDYLSELTLPANESEPQRPRRRVSLRLAATMAAAASLLFAFALWNSQTAYGWASMLRALENCNWVQAASETAGHSGWVSSQRGIVAIRSGDKVAFCDHREGISSQYLSDRRVVYQQDLPAGRSSSGAEELFGLFLDESATSGFRVIAESWRRVAPRDGLAEAVELRVTLGVDGKSFKLLVLLDADTHLPKTCRLLTNGQDVAKVLDFAYPAEGPSSIFSLGVPRETEVVASMAGLDAEESETTRFAVQLLGNNSEQNDWVAAETQAKKTAEVDSRPSAAKEPTGQADRRLASMRSRPPVVLPAQPLALEKLVEQINSEFAAGWHSQGISAAKRASDTEFLRRVYLDLTGRIPMVSEVYEFLDDLHPSDDSQNRRKRLVDELLASRDHATHLASVWRTLLLPEGVDANIYGGTSKFDQWLADRFEKNLPYDQLVRQLLLAEGRVSDSGPILFYAALKLNPEELAGRTARAFLGMRMECAQCHDHPFDESISQEDFWGFAAHFAQISRPRGKMDMTSSVLRVRDNLRGEVRLPDSDEVIPPRLPYLVQSSSHAKPSQKNKTQESASSRREALVEWLTTTQNSRFARATVNRAWHHLFGLGLVEPVDDMRADNQTTFPVVLETLSLDFAASGYDLRRLLRALVLSDAYQLSSQAVTDDPSQSLVFARMNIKSFTADQLYDCIRVATQSEAVGSVDAADGALARFGNTSRQAFIEQFQAPPGQRTDYHAGIPQALTLMHGRLIYGATDLASSGLLKSLKAPFFTDEQRIETLFLSTLSRFPEPAEQETMLAHLEAASDEEGRSRALGDVLWALLNSAEFTFIH